MAFDRLRRLRDSFRQNIWHVKEPKRELTNAELKSQFTFASKIKMNQRLQDTTDENEHTQTESTTMRGEPGQEFILRVSGRETERSHNRRGDVTAWISQDRLEHERSTEEAAVEQERSIEEAAVEHERSVEEDATEPSLGSLSEQGTATLEPAALIITGSLNAQSLASQEPAALAVTDTQYNTPLQYTPASSPDKASDGSYSLVDNSPQASDMGQSSSAFSAVRITPPASPSSTTAVQGVIEYDSTTLQLEQTDHDIPNEEGLVSSLTGMPSVEDHSQHSDLNSQPTAASGPDADKHVEISSTTSRDPGSDCEDNIVEHAQRSNTDLRLHLSVVELELQRQLNLPLVEARPGHISPQDEPGITVEEEVKVDLAGPANAKAAGSHDYWSAHNEWTYRGATEEPSSDSSSTSSNNSETSSARAWSVTANADDVGYAATSQAQPAQDLWLEEFRAAIMSRSLRTRASNDLLAISNGTAEAPEQAQPFSIFFTERPPLPAIQPEYIPEDLHPAYLKVKTNLHLQGLGMPYLHKDAEPVIQHNKPRQHYKASITAAEAREFTEAVYDELWRGGITF